MIDQFDITSDQKIKNVNIQNEIHTTNDNM